MTLPELLAHCRERGIKLAPEGVDGLSIDAPRGCLSPALKAALKAHKAALLAELKWPAIDDRIVASLNSLFENGKATFEELEALHDRRSDAVVNRDMEALRDIERASAQLAQSITEAESEWGNRPVIDASWVKKFRRVEPQTDKKPPGSGMRAAVHSKNIFKESR